MKNGLTEMVFILDRSGSMSGLEKDTIGGFNSLIRKQRGEEGEAYVSVVLFDHESEVLYDRVPLSKVPEMTERDYWTRGSTALLDAVGGAIHHIGNVHKYIREEDVPERTVFVITTDGMENASRTYTAEKVKQMVENRREKDGWEFLFLGANMDAVETAQRYGIDRDRAVSFCNDEAGIEKNYAAVNEAVLKVRQKKMLCPDWKQDIEADYAARKGKK